MREVKCPICKRFKKIKSDIVLSICPSCQVIMIDTRIKEFKEDEVGYCDHCNLPENNL